MTAIVYDQSVVERGIVHAFRMRGALIALDIANLAKAVFEITNTLKSARETKIVFDLTEVDPVLFKARRFSFLCDTLAEEIAKGLAVTVDLRLTDEHTQFLLELADLEGFDLLVNGKSLRAQSAPHAGLLRDERFLGYFAAGMVMICLSAVVAGLEAYPNTLLGFTLFFSGGILFIETIILIRALKSKADNGRTDT